MNKAQTKDANLTRSCGRESACGTESIAAVQTKPDPQGIAVILIPTMD